MLPIDRVTLLFGDDVEITLALHIHSKRRVLPDVPPQRQKHDSEVHYHAYLSLQSTYHLEYSTKAHSRKPEPLPENHQSDKRALIIIQRKGMYSHMSGC